MPLLQSPLEAIICLLGRPVHSAWVTGQSCCALRGAQHASNPA